MMWSTCGVGCLGKKSGMAGTKRSTLDQNWKTLRPGTWTSSFTNGPELIEA